MKTIYRMVMSTNGKWRSLAVADNACCDALILRLHIVAATLDLMHCSDRHQQIEKAIHLLEQGGEWRFDGEDMLVYPHASTSSGIRLKRWKERGNK